MALYSTRNLTLSYGTKILFNRADFFINPGDKIGLLGLNGKGKSSLFKIISEQIAPDRTDPACQVDRSKKFSCFQIPQDPGIDPSETRDAQWFFFEFYPHLKKIWNELQEINQELDSQKDLSKNEKNLERQKVLMDEIDRENGWELLRKYESYARSFGIENLESPLGLMSGGEQKKLLLSLGLSSEAELILWDEPTNHLDLESIEKFEDELAYSDKTFIMTSHDRYLLGKVTKKTFYLQRGKIERFEGGYTDYLEHLASKEKDRLILLNKLKNKAKRETDWMRQGIKARGTRSKKRVENYHLLQDKVADLKSHAQKKIQLSLQDSSKKTKQLVEFKNVNFSFGERDLLQNFNFILHKGDKVGLLGSNGTGKSTLAKLMTGELIQTTGNIKKLDTLQFRHFSQKRDELDPETTPFKLIGDGTDQVILPGGHSLHIASYIKKFLFESSDLDRPLKTFSGGEQNRIQLANNLRRQGDLWIFDEPTNDLDLETIQILEKALTDFKGSLILISHDRAFLSNVTNRIFLIDEGGLEVFEGGYSQVEPYLEMKNLVKAETPLEKQEVIPVKVIKESVDKKGFSKIQKLIEDKESLIDKIDSLLQELGSIQTSEESADQMTRLAQKKEIEEEELLLLYEKLED